MFQEKGGLVGGRERQGHTHTHTETYRERERETLPALLELVV